MESREGALHQLAEPTLIVSLTGTAVFWVSASPPLGIDAATRHGPRLTLVLLLSKSAVRNHCTIYHSHLNTPSPLTLAAISLA